VARNVRLAVATGLLLAALVLGLLYLGAAPFFALALLILLIAQGEFYLAARQAGHSPATALGLVGGALLLLGVFFKDESAAGIVLFLTLVFCFIWYLAMESRANLVTNIGVTILGLAYVPLLGSFVALMLSRPHDGRAVTIVAVGGAALYDVYAYAAGSRFGKTALAPAISPNKTREGALIATAGLLVTSALAAPLIGPWNVPQALVLGMLISVSAPMGDLFESLLKRGFGIKDMSAILPGHGGALDRIDAMLFTAPTVYFSLRLFGL